MTKELSVKSGSRIVKEIRTLAGRYALSFGKIRLPIKLNHVTMLQIHYTRRSLMYSKEVIIQNKTGLHARPASIFVKEATRFKSDIKMIKNNKKYNAKSIMGILSMAGSKGQKIVIQAIGEDEEDAVKELADLITNKLIDED